MCYASEQAPTGPSGILIASSWATAWASLNLNIFDTNEVRLLYVIPVDPLLTASQLLARAV